MTIPLSDTLTALSTQTSKVPIMILEIDGFTTKFSSKEIDSTFKPYIMLRGTTTNITSQVKLEEGSSSVTRIKVAMADVNEELTVMFSPGNTVDDLLGRLATFYLTFEGGTHPADSIRVMSGVIDQMAFGPGTAILSIASSEQLKRQELFTQASIGLNGSHTNSVTTITVDDTTNFINEADILKSYIRISDEIIRYTGTTSTTFTGCTRGALNTTAATHDDNDNVDSFYTLTGEPIEIALKLMLSESTNTAFVSSVDVLNFVTISGTETDTNAIVFDLPDVKDTYGLVIGDTITTTGASNGANNVTDKVITGFGYETTLARSTIIVGSETFVVEDATAGVIAFKSQYNTLPEGVSLTPQQVDVQQHEDLADLLVTFPTLEVYLKDTINAKEFIEKELYLPTGFYQITRKGRASLNVTLPPLAGIGTKTLDETNILNANKLTITRSSSNKKFFNTFVHKYEVAAIEDKFTKGTVLFSQASKTRIPVGTKSLTIESNGLRNNAATNNYVDQQQARFADRYRFAAEGIKGVEVNLKTGFNIEVGDSVLFDGSSLSVTDILNGTRSFVARSMEVINKSLNIKSGKVKLDLLDTGFNLQARYGTFGPSSIVDTSSTTTVINVIKSYGTGVSQDETFKWEDYIGESVRVHNLDYSNDDESVIVSLTATSITVAPALSFTPASTDVVNMPVYDTTDAMEQFIYKNTHCFANPTLTIVTGTSGTEFTVSAGDALLLSVGSSVRVHNDSYSIDSTASTDTEDAKVTVINSTTITVNRDLGFTPAVGQSIELVGFKDGGLPYRYF